MKHIFFLTAIICVSCSNVHAQQGGNYNYSGGTYNYLDRYPVNYYSPVLWGPNGYRTVTEENILMDQMLAERRRQREKEEGLPDEAEQARKKREEDAAAKKKAADAKNKPVAKAKKN